MSNALWDFGLWDVDDWYNPLWDSAIWDVDSWEQQNVWDFAAWDFAIFSA